MIGELDLVFRAPRVITVAGEAGRCVGARDGVVVAIEPHDSGLRGAHTVDLGVDEVLHVNEPGRTEWEGFATATKAAAGGLTTILDTPLNCIPATVDVAALDLNGVARCPGTSASCTGCTTPGCSVSRAGVVRGTWLRGRQIAGDDPHGQFLTRGET